MTSSDHQPVPTKGAPPSRTDHASQPALPHSPLQAPVWQRVSQLRGKPTFTGNGAGWSALAILERRAVGSYLYIPYGPLAHQERDFINALAWSRRKAEELNAMFLRVEAQSPGSWLEPSVPADVARRRAVLARTGFRPALGDLQPRRTRCIDLTQPTERILGAMTGTNRTVYRSTEKRNIRIEHSQEPSDIRHLQELVAANAEQRGYAAQDAHHVTALAQAALPGGDGTLHLAWHEDRVISAVLTVDGGGTRVFAHGASDPAARQLRGHQSLIISAIMDAKLAGLRVADLYGIAPTDDPAHPWAGFSKFKASFGGHVVEHSGAWDLPLAPRAYHAVRTGRQALQWIRSKG